MDKACDAVPMLVFVPLDPRGLAEWARSGRRDVTGFAATAAFLDTFDLTEATSEDADLTLLELAGLEGLLTYGTRLIAVGQFEAVGIEPAEFGAVAADGVAWTRIESLFADDARGADGAALLLKRVEGRSLEDAWDDDATTELLRTTELLWHGPTEWEGLI